MNDMYLAHHGVKGMKWGVRRYQNRDGSLTSAGKRKYGYVGNNPTPERLKNRILKDGYSDPTPERLKNQTRSLTSAQKQKIARVGVGIATVATAAYVVHKNPEKIGRALSKLKGVKVKDISNAAINRGKQVVNTMVQSAKEGIKEGIKDAPKKATKAVTTGIVMNTTKRVLDSTVGKEESARIFQANDNKKIGKFWKVSPDDKDDD